MNKTSNLKISSSVFQWLSTKLREGDVLLFRNGTWALFSGWNRSSVTGWVMWSDNAFEWRANGACGTNKKLELAMVAAEKALERAGIVAEAD